MGVYTNRFTGSFLEAPVIFSFTTKLLDHTHIEAFLTHLAVAGKVLAFTQNQALSALLFLYQQVLNIDLPFLEDITRAKRPKHVPTILKGTSKNLASLIFSLPNFTFLPEGRGFINELHVIFRNLFLHTLVLRKQKLPTH